NDIQIPYRKLHGNSTVLKSKENTELSNLLVKVRKRL
ncbi:unnamed protein product, partial [Allacma fusca]